MTQHKILKTITVVEVDKRCEEIINKLNAGEFTLSEAVTEARRGSLTLNILSRSLTFCGKLEEQNKECWKSRTERNFLRLCWKKKERGF